jgi:phosphoadenosine phosphosulfate reductase
MLVENSLFGEVDKVKKAIDRLKTFEPPEGYYLAFSGGKDSQTIYHLAKEAKVKFDAHYNVTGIDPPELVQFIKTNYSDVKRDMYKKSMWRLIEKLGPPLQQMRYCCKELKEHGGEGRYCVTGVRWAESSRRSINRNAFEYMGKKKSEKILFNDNDIGRRQFEQCNLKGKFVINPIIDWEEEDVWSYLNGRGIKHCSLYDEGFTRLGCIGCPMANLKRITEFERWPKFREAYLRAFKKWLNNYPDKKQKWKDENEVMEWWLYDKKVEKPMPEQIYLEDII